MLMIPLSVKDMTQGCGARFLSMHGRRTRGGSPETTKNGAPELQNVFPAVPSDEHDAPTQRIAAAAFIITLLLLRPPSFTHLHDRA